MTTLTSPTQTSHTTSTTTAAADATTAAAEPALLPGGRRSRRAQLLRRPGVVVAVLYVLLALGTAAVPGLYTGVDPQQPHPADKLLPPGGQYWFGTDELGRDLFARVVHGSALTVQATLVALAIAVVAGLLVGLVSGFCGGWVDVVLMRGVDVVLAIPTLLLSLTIITALGFGTVNVAIAVGVALVPGFARITRAEVLRVKTLPYIEAARSGGATWTSVLRRHVLPNTWGPVVVLAVLDVGTAILAVSSLSFLGFGAQPPHADWGSLIASGRTYLVTNPWLSLLPGLAVGLLVLSLNHVAKSLEEVAR
ncbi:peptide/nickel transport system permease protein [Quadrisphaera granulorum]|uniref:Peptide/nickel transport system permease protein n=1 Tax=Quadrisphaera granulorum TaxID=317664 RepID=A0A315ZRX7_9ACTN|nr:ABC transporter permease [Quadrisphaera granulorum]PWJ48305.1 peptide/nickel transport system permease protein [Quadrisphaera granulorum]SZE98466.1 peptide/nickel transport system permease protein [Quadrisphaera granulorum]